MMSSSRASVLECCGKVLRDAALASGTSLAQASRVALYSGVPSAWRLTMIEME